MCLVREFENESASKIAENSNFKDSQCTSIVLWWDRLIENNNDDGSDDDYDDGDDDQQY